MNKLKWAIFKKRQLYNSYISYKSQKNWEIFRKQRNYAVNIRRQSVNQYFIERCAGGFLVEYKTIFNKQRYKCQEKILYCVKTGRVS